MRCEQTKSFDSEVGRLHGSKHMKTRPLTAGDNSIQQRPLESSIGFYILEAAYQREILPGQNLSHAGKCSTEFPKHLH